MERYDGDVREIGTSTLVGAALLLIVSGCGSESVSRVEYATAACLAFDEILSEGGDPDVGDLPDPPAVYRNWHDAFVQMLEAWDSDVEGTLASAFEAMSAAEDTLDANDLAILHAPLQARHCDEEAVATERVEYAAALCVALADARGTFSSLGAREALSDLPTPPAVYRNIHTVAMRLLQAVAGDSDEDEDRLRATLAASVAALDEDDRTIIDAACSALP